MKPIQKAIVDGSFVLDLKAGDIESIIHQTVNHVVAQGKLPEEKREEVETAILQRETVAPTAIGHSVGVPHVYMDVFESPLIVFVRLAHPLNLGAPDGIPTRFLFVLLGPPNSTAEHLDSLASIARLMSEEHFRYDAGEARNRQELLAALQGYRQRTETEPPKKPASDALGYSGRLFGGVIADVRRRWPHYKSDFLDGIHSKAISSTLFLFFACLAPAIAFGGVMADYTGDQIGAVEMLVASAICGVIFALFSGQPLVILGGTGPLLAFTVILYNLCGQLEIAFLPTRAWVGLWTALLVLILAATDASRLMRFFTRFTDEIFAALISIIFVFLAIKSLADICVDVYSKGGVSHDEALVPLLLAGGTFFVAMSLSRFRRSRYLLPQMREFLADFGPSIALGAMIGVALFWFKDVRLGTLPAPTQFGPTKEGRSWLINIFEVPPWVWIASIGPAILVAVLAFMDQNITARLVNSPDHKLEKGEAYHYDLAVVGVLLGFCSLFGFPWLVAATVRSLNHVRSLATKEEVIAPGGETRERIIHVRENRVTGVAIHLLIGVSLLFLPLLNEIPMAALYGLFLYMGVVSMSGNQFFERMSLWLMDRSLYPVTHYTRRVPIWTIHTFTLVQLLCLGMLLIVEISPMGILFPLFVALLVPIRLLLNRFIPAEDLEALDADEIPEEEEMQWG